MIAQTNSQALVELTDAEIDAVAGGFHLFGGDLTITRTSGQIQAVFNDTTQPYTGTVTGTLSSSGLSITGTGSYANWLVSIPL